MKARQHLDVKGKRRELLANVKHHRQAAGVSRVRAAAIARLGVARELLACSVYEELPAEYSAYWHCPPPKKCWYVVCGAEARNMLDGPPKILLCISKRTGRVLRRMSIRSGG